MLFLLSGHIYPAAGTSPLQVGQEAALESERKQKLLFCFIWPAIRSIHLDKKGHYPIPEKEDSAIETGHPKRGLGKVMRGASSGMAVTSVSGNASLVTRKQTPPTSLTRFVVFAPRPHDADDVASLLSKPSFAGFITPQGIV
ncbi:hypothetical protein CEXT_527301 [Caerostris extrusa]|uniref:Uncharacterized protein n=1 Tax=Caerostris extrusa TaxID=172846 RepID=A0AAV4N5D0_CAEEX|nr:hypothetical protein CEXT_527301 [Caerostris extrusa]